MTGWNRTARIPAAQRRWINLIWAALHKWSRPYLKSLLSLPLSDGKRQRRVLLGIEPLEVRIVLAPSVFVYPYASVSEGSSLNFPVYLSPSSTNTVTVQYAISDGTARAGIDYQSASGTLTFPPGATTEYVTFNSLDDNLVNEPNPETAVLTLSNPTNATANPSANVTVFEIQEDETSGSNVPPAYMPSPCSNDG